jgi:hypothetical protein
MSIKYILEIKKLIVLIDAAHLNFNSKMQYQINIWKHCDFNSSLLRKLGLRIAKRLKRMGPCVGILKGNLFIGLILNNYFCFKINKTLFSVA